MSFFWKMAFRNLLRNHRRTFATGIAFVAGFVGLNLLGGYILRVESYLKVSSIYNNRTGHISLYKKGGFDNFALKPRKYLITQEELTKLNQVFAAIEQVEFTSPMFQGMGLLSNGQKSVPFLGLGIDPQIEKRIQEHPLVQKWTWELTPPSTEKTLKDNPSDNDSNISVTPQLAELIGRKPPFQNLAQDQREIMLAAMSVYGVFNGVNADIQYRHQTGVALTEDTSLVAPLSLLQKLFETDGGVSSVSIFLKPGASVARAMKQLETLTQEASLETELIPFDDDRIGLFYVGTMGFLYIMAGFFVFLIFTAVALSMINSTTIAILERFKEIASLKSIGFQDTTVAQLFTRESVILSFICFVLGLLLTKFAAFLVNSSNIRFRPPGPTGDMQFILTPDLWLCCVIGVLLLLISVTCTHLVANKIVKKSIVDLMVNT